MDSEIEQGTILRGVVGSTVHGLAIEGQDDRDEMGVFIESPAHVCGLTPLDHYVQRDRPAGVRSEPGDLDLTLYSLRKFCRLAAKGNPSVLLMLYLPEYMVQKPLGELLVTCRDMFKSKHAGRAFLGYLTAQKQKMLGERAHTVNRPELVAQHGYDTKFAMHALRLGIQGVEYLKYGEITLPCKAYVRDELMSIREGKTNKDEALRLILDTESDLKKAIDDTDLPDEPDTFAINQFLCDAHMIHWNGMGQEEPKSRILRVS